MASSTECKWSKLFNIHRWKSADSLCLTMMCLWKGFGERNIQIMPRDTSITDLQTVIVAWRFWFCNNLDDCFKIRWYYCHVPHTIVSVMVGSYDNKLHLEVIGENCKHTWIMSVPNFLSDTTFPMDTCYIGIALRRNLYLFLKENNVLSFKESSRGFDVNEFSSLQFDVYDLSFSNVIQQQHVMRTKSR